MRYLFGGLLTFTDIATDILTAASYYRNQHIAWFTFCLSFALLPSILVSFAFLLQSFKEPSAKVFAKRFVCFANPCGSGILKLKLFIVCLRNFDRVWSDNGSIVENELLREDYRSEKVYHYVEGLLENMPQVILQIYVAIVQDEKVSTLQILSISITYTNLVWVLASFEYNTFIRDADLNHFLVVVIYNACVVAARGLSIVAFLLAFTWFTSAVLAFHEFVCITIYFYTNHHHFGAKEIWWIGSLLLPCYVFVFMGFKVIVVHTKIFEIKLGRSLASSALFYFCFVAENVVMASLFFSWSKTSSGRWSLWISGTVTVSAIALSLLGALTHLAFTFVFFFKAPRVGPAAHSDQEARTTRPGAVYVVAP